MSGTILGANLFRRGIQAGISQKFRMGQIGTAKCLTTTCTLPAPTTKVEDDFFDKNKRLNRPLSPHLSIYKFQITSVLSVTHRGTGIALSGLTSAFAIGMLLTPSPFPTYLSVLQSTHLGSGIIFGAKFLLAFPLFFHSFNGVRHLAWDLGKGFEIKSVYQSGYAVLASSILASLLAAAA